MSTTITKSFIDFKNNIEITDLQNKTVSTRQQEVRDVIETGLTVLDSFLTGSYRRNTLISPLNTADIDIFIVLDTSYYNQSGQASLLDKVKNVLKNRYPKTPKISRNGQAVTITFSDFMVDVVPGFYRSGGGFLIADSINNRWISTDPKKHVDIWSSENSYHNGNLVPLIKMLKVWNREHSSLLRSFHLETMILEILRGVRIDNFPSGSRYIFDRARNIVNNAIYDPSGYGGNLQDYLNTQKKIDDIVSRFETAYKRAVDAETYDANGNTEAAVERWRLIFGNYFPAYG